MNFCHSHWDIFLTVKFFPVACLSGRALRNRISAPDLDAGFFMAHAGHTPNLPSYIQFFTFFSGICSLSFLSVSRHLFVLFVFSLDSSLFSLEHVGVILRSPHKRWPYRWTTQCPSSQAKLTALSFVSGSIHNVLVLRAQGTSLPSTRFQKACWKYSIMLFSLASPVSDKLEQKHTYRQYTKHSIQPSVVLSVKHMHVYGAV